MKTCPYCGHENESAAVACVGCGEEFEQLSPEQKDSQLLDPALSPRVVATFSSLPEASMLVDRLEASGIEADIPEEYSPQIFSAVIALERLTVRVAAKDYEAAKQIATEASEVLPADAQSLNAMSEDKPDPAEFTSEPETGKECVSCGARIPLAARQCPICGYTQPDSL